MLPFSQKLILLYFELEKILKFKKVPGFPIFKQQQYIIFETLYGHQ